MMRHHAIAIQRADHPLYCRLSRTVTPPSAKFGRPGARDSSVDCASGCLGKVRNAERPVHPREVHQTTHSRPTTRRAEYFERFPKDRYQTEIESWRHLQSDNVEFTLKRLREPIDSGNHGG
jgi:hypothetical protein